MNPYSPLVQQSSPALFLSVLQCCFQVVKSPAQVMWDATGGLLQAQLIPCCSFAKVLSAIIMSAESQASTQPVTSKIHKGSALEKDYAEFSFHPYLWVFWLGFALCQSCACPRGAVNCSRALASYSWIPVVAVSLGLCHIFVLLNGSVLQQQCSLQTGWNWKRVELLQIEELGKYDLALPGK